MYTNEIGTTTKKERSELTNLMMFPEKTEKDTHEDPCLSSSTADKESTFWQKCNSFWVWEITTCTVGIACLGIVIWALVTLDGKPRSHWPVGMEPTSFLSLFITVSRFMILVGVAAGIAQLRWLYFLGDSRPLDHLDSFDSASRGPWGSLLLLCMTNIRGTASYVARIGAAITIVALAMDPFTQQTLKQFTQLQNLSNHTDAWVLAVNFAPESQSEDSFFSDYSRRRSIYGGILGFDEVVTHNCPSGNCTWPDFTSLGYSFVCKDVGAIVSRACADNSTLGQNCTAIRYSLPENALSLTLRNGSGALDNTNTSRVYTILQSNITDVYPAGSKDPILFSFLIAQLLVNFTEDNYDTSDLRNPSWNLTACDVKWTGKLYQGLAVSNGQFNDLPPLSLDLVPLANSTCWTQPSLNCQEFTPANLSAVPTGSPSTYRILSGNNPVSVRSFLKFDYNLTVPISEGNASLGQTIDLYNLGSGLFWNVNITSTFAEVATTLTNYLRSRPKVAYHVQGTLQINTLYTRIVWGWIALPAASVLLGALFLLGVIIYTAMGVKGERPIWKTNTLPLLMHGLEGYHRYGYAGAETTDAIFRKAMEMAVQLRRNEDGEIRFVRT